MKFVNKTKWDTRDLRMLTLAVLRGGGHRLPHRFTVKYSRGRHVSGYACYGQYRIKGVNLDFQTQNTFIVMKVPSPQEAASWSIGDDGRRHEVEFVPREFPIKSYAQVLVHEVGHNENLHHKDMVPVIDIPVHDSIYSMKVNPVVKKPKPVRNVREERHQHALAMLKRNQSKLKRLQTQVRKWGRKVKYYEREVG